MAKWERERGNSNAHKNRRGSNSNSAIPAGNKHRRVGWPTCGHKGSSKGTWDIPGEDNGKKR